MNWGSGVQIPLQAFIKMGYKKIWNKTWPIFYFSAVIGLITYLVDKIKIVALIVYCIFFIIIQIITNFFEKVKLKESIKQILELILIILFTLIINYVLINNDLIIRFIVLYLGSIVLTFLWSFILYKLNLS